MKTGDWVVVDGIVGVGGCAASCIRSYMGGGECRYLLRGDYD